MFHVLLSLIEKITRSLPPSMWALLLLWLPTHIQATPFDATAQLPVSYQGRFRALKPASELWLYDTYHNTSIKKQDLPSYETASTSALELLWKMHFFGHTPWDTSPFFWIHYASLKSLLDLSPTQDRFSYEILNNRLYENSKTNLAVLSPLIAYEFSSHYLSPINRVKSKKIELSNLAEGLRIVQQDHKLQVITVPSAPLWNFLKPGMQLADEFSPAIAIKEYKRITEEFLNLLQTIQLYTALQSSNAIDAEFTEAFHRLKEQNLSPIDIAKTLESKHSLASRLQRAGNTMKMLPSRHAKGEWLSLHALKLKTYHAGKNHLVYASNFTEFPDELFHNLRQTYLEMESATQNMYFPKNIEDPHTEQALKEAATSFAHVLEMGYSAIAGTPYKKSAGKTLTYPTTTQLKAEVSYHQLPLVGAAIACYGIGLLILIVYTLLARFSQNQRLLLGAVIIFALAFVLHTTALALRIFILERPPVSNMFETVLYVPWIAMLVGFFFFARSRNSLTLAAAGTASLILLILLKLTNVDSRLENVQAVLDSQYWLSVHVLMVVGSYGIFAVCGILGHFYLIATMRGTSPGTIQFLAKSILHTMYVGVGLLIPGTILGGVWAAESWGRFWDWDPKESWAFISACVYLLVIHAYTFRYIKDFGLAVGSVAGLIAISFTWYGVNYILGTGLHSYGFGKGGESYYFLYLLTELTFLAVASIARYKTSIGIHNKSS